VLGLTNAQANVAQRRVGRDGGEQLAQPLERVGLQLGEKGIHNPELSGISTLGKGRWIE